MIKLLKKYGVELKLKKCDLFRLIEGQKDTFLEDGFAFKMTNEEEMFKYEVILNGIYNKTKIEGEYKKFVYETQDAIQYLNYEEKQKMFNSIIRLMVFVVGAQSGIRDISAKVLIFLILSGLSTGISWLCYFKALQIGDINKVTPIDKSSTVITMLLAFIFLREEITWLKFVSMILIGIGTYLMIQKKETKEKAEDKKWLLYAVGSAVFASLTSILGKIGIQDVNSNLGTAIRTAVVLVMAWIVVFVTGKQNTVNNIDRKSWLFLILSGFATGGSWLCYYRALQTGPASVVVPIDKLSILVTIAFSYIVFHEKLSLKSGTGLLLIVVGTLALLI